MTVLIPWAIVEVGDLEIFAPAVPCLVVHTWYIDSQPDSTVTYFWQDDATGLINHEIVFAEPVGFDAALTWAQQHAPSRGIERIHVKHGPSQPKPLRVARPSGVRKKPARPAKARAPAKPKSRKTRGRRLGPR